MKVIKRYKYDADEFNSEFIDTNVVIYKGHINNWPAVQRWSPDYFSNTCPDISITTKVFEENEIIVKQQLMREYVRLLDQYKILQQTDPNVVTPYCHDVPIFQLSEKLKDDVGSFPVEIMPPWYAEKWWQFAQFFMSSKHSVTPLHFDTLLTSNIFFQIQGRKLFTVYGPEDEKFCYRKKWRWFDVDPEDVDLQTHPKYGNTQSLAVLVEAGDMFYMPPGTIHHVRSLEDSISFNVDFHTQKSCIHSFKGVFKGMPVENLKFNLLCLRSLYLGDANGDLFQRYSKYLNYIS